MTTNDSNGHIDSNNDRSLKENTQQRLSQEDEMKVTATNFTQQIKFSNNLEKEQKNLKRPLQSKENVVPKKRSKMEKMPHPSVRFDDIKHFPKIDKSKPVRCKNESCENKKKYISCSKCNVHLCICVVDNRNCFEDFHTLKKNSA